MANRKISDLTAATTPFDSTDLLELVQDVGGTPVSVKASMGDIRAGVGDVTVKKAGTAVGTRGGINLIEGANVTLTVTDDAANDEIDVTIAAAGGGGAGGGWTQVINENGTSIANWTTVGGTWSTSGTYLQQTDATAAYRMLRFTTRVAPGAGFAMEAEVRFPSGSLAAGRAMLAPVGAGAVGSTHDPWLGVTHNSLSIVQRGDQQTLTEAYTIADDTWYTVRAEIMGNMVTLYVAGVVVSAYEVTGPASAMVVAHFCSLVAYGGAVHFRNIKAWRLASPA